MSALRAALVGRGPNGHSKGGESYHHDPARHDRAIMTITVVSLTATHVGLRSTTHQYLPTVDGNFGRLLAAVLCRRHRRAEADIGEARSSADAPVDGYLGTIQHCSSANRKRLRFLPDERCFG